MIVSALPSGIRRPQLEDGVLHTDLCVIGAGFHEYCTSVQFRNALISGAVDDAAPDFFLFIRRFAPVIEH